MDVGQMIAQMLVGIPATSAMPVTSAITAMQEDEQEASAFAGVLQGMSVSDATSLATGAVPAKALPAGNSDTMEADPAPTQAHTTPDSMAMLLAMANTGNNVMSSSPAVEDPIFEQPERQEHLEGTDPQNVVWSLAGMQALPTQQINGRTPDSAVMLTDATPQTARIADSVELLEGHAVVMLETTGASCITPSTMQFPDIKGSSSNSHGVPAFAMQQNVAVSTSAQQDSSAAQTALSSATQPDNAITTTGSATMQASLQTVMQETPVASMSVVSVPAQPEGMLAEESVRTTEKTVSKQPETTTMDNLTQSVWETGFQTSAIPAGDSGAHTAPAEQAVNSLPAVEEAAHDVQAALAVRLSAGDKPDDVQAVKETQTSKPEAGKIVEGAESPMGENAVALKKTVAPFSGEFFGQDRDSASGQKTGTQDHVALLHQMKIENAPAITNTSGVPAGEPVRTNMMEQVVNQVREHLAGRDMKSGSEQVVIRLSPENLGDLKLNLRMENQCLKVSIVAENNQVRDSLIKHSDILKETLARQNITMESFDVSTNSNGSGASLHGQGRNGWQELAQQQRDTVWSTARGYRIDNTPEMVQRPLYQASAEYSMVDVRF